MKKLLSIVLVIITVFCISGCKKSDSALETPMGDPSKVEGAEYVQETGEDAKAETKVDEEEVQVYLPADYIYSTVQSVSDDAKSKGGYDVKVYEDGAVSYTMSRSDYDAMMEKNRTAFEGNIESLKAEYARVYTDIKYNEDFSQFDFYVNRDAYTSSGDTLLQETLFSGSRMFQVYMGKDPKTIKMDFKIYDNATNEVVEKGSFPDELSHE